MAIYMSRRKSKPSKRIQANGFSFFCSFLAKTLFQLPILVFLLILVYVWSSSTTIISGNVVHLCVSSRKLTNLYCLSAGTQPNFRIPIPLVNETSPSSTIGSEGGTKLEKKTSFVPISLVNETSLSFTIGTEGGTELEEKTSFTTKTSDKIKIKNEELEEAYREVEEIIRVHRSWASSSNEDTCEGRGIYVYELPSKFNKDLLAQCREMIPWIDDFCKFFSNEGLGEPIQNLGRGWYHTHQYSLEPIFHARISKHPCRVYDPNVAKLFYVPFYGGLDILRWHFNNVSNDVKDSLTLELLRWLESQSSWYRNLGKDHIFVLGKISWDFRRKEKSSWGTRFLELDEMQNPIKLLIERQPWHINDVGIPHPTYFHPQTDEDIVSWQTKIIKSNRKSLISFAGAARPGSSDSIRSILIDDCTKNGQCTFLNCTSGQCDRPDSIIDLFVESEFCLQPPGDSPTRKSLFDSLVSGCIPVLFDPMTAYYQYPWHLPEDQGKYTVYIGKEDVRNRAVHVMERLMEISVKERENMRRYIVYELLPGLVYGDLNSKFDKFQDAFSITVNSLINRMDRLNEL